MGYEVLALKYRPQSFKDCVGQEEVSQTLRNSITQDRVGHAYLFTGPRGVGKTSLARIFAKSLNCENSNDGESCGACERCEAITKCIDMDVVEFDGASNNKVEDIRDLIGNVNYRPVNSKYKVYIIDEVHMVTTAAFNALLKTLEEPPSHVKFIFATTEIQKIPDTIISRCQIMGFKQIQAKDIFRRLKYICEQENVEFKEEALQLIANKAKGAHRDSQSLLDQIIAFTNGSVTLEAVNEITGSISDEKVLTLIETVFNSKDADIFIQVLEFIQSGYDLPEICERLMELLRDLIIVQECGKNAESLISNPFTLDKLKEIGTLVRRDGIQYMIQMLSETRFKIKTSPVPRVLLEMTLLRMSHSTDLIALADIAKAIKTGKASISGNSTPAPQIVSQNTNTSPQNQQTSFANNPLVKKKDNSVPAPKSITNTEFTGPEKVSLPQNESLASKFNDLQSGWPRILQDITSKDAILSKILQNGNAKIDSYQGSNINIVLDSKSTKQMLKSISTEGRKQTISNVIHDRFKISVIIQISISQVSIQESKINEPNEADIPKKKNNTYTPPPTKAEDLRQKEKTALNDPDLQKIIKGFNCDIINVTPNDKGN